MLVYLRMGRQVGSVQPSTVRKFEILFNVLFIGKNKKISK